MDRNVFAACAVSLASACVLVGCESKPAPAPRATAPKVLAELQAASPGPWRAADSRPIAVTSLEHPADPYAPPAELQATDVDELRNRASAKHLAPHLVASDVIAPPPAAAPPQLRFATPEAPPAADLPPQPLRPAAPIEPVRPIPPVAETEQRSLSAVPAVNRGAEKLPPVTPPAAAGPTEVLPSWSSPAPADARLNLVRQEAEAHIRKAFRLAERNALYLARSEFVAALELIAQENDVRHYSQFYSDALAAGLTALEESNDFVRRTPAGKRPDIQRIVAGHKTPILKDSASDKWPPVVAAQRYYAYAQEHLSAAAAGEPYGSMALFGLAKISLAVASESGGPNLESRSQAIALYEAALMADSRNYRAANELGVLLARHGELARSRDLLAHSVRLAPHPATQRNLAAVYGKLGQTELAAKAQADALALEKAGHHGNGPAVQWVDPATFATTAPASDTLLPPISEPAAVPGSEAPIQAKEENVSTARRGFSDWLPWSRR